MNRTSLSRLAFAVAVAILAACTKGTSPSPDQKSSGAPTSSPVPARGDWTANGGTACDTYFTPSVMAEILVKPTGKNKQVGPDNCSFMIAGGGQIDIMLGNISPELFDNAVSHMTDVVPMKDVGDKAVHQGRRHTFGVEAVKGKDRSCIVQTAASSGSMKATDEVLARRFGDICKQLLALP